MRHHRCVHGHARLPLQHLRLLVAHRLQVHVRLFLHYHRAHLFVLVKHTATLNAIVLIGLVLDGLLVSWHAKVRLVALHVHLACNILVARAAAVLQAIHVSGAGRAVVLSVHLFVRPVVLCAEAGSLDGSLTAAFTEALRLVVAVATVHTVHGSYIVKAAHVTFDSLGALARRVLARALVFEAVWDAVLAISAVAATTAIRRQYLAGVCHYHFTLVKLVTYQIDGILDLREVDFLVLNYERRYLPFSSFKIVFDLFL